MEEEGTAGADNIVTEFSTYEDFLDSQITSLDLYYLEVSMMLIKFDNQYTTLIYFISGRPGLARISLEWT